VAGVGVWVAQEVGEGDGAEAIVVDVVGGVEFDHDCGCEVVIVLYRRRLVGFNYIIAIGIDVLGRARRGPSPG